jgi:hypothetical protein
MLVSRLEKCPMGEFFCLEILLPGGFRLVHAWKDVMKTLPARVVAAAEKA